MSTTSCATKPPIEKPSRSISVSPSAVTKAIIWRAVSAIVGPNAPLDELTPG
jgi:hypothetical protein